MIVYGCKIWCTIFHGLQHVIGRTSGVTYGVLDHCSVCDKYYFQGGFEDSLMGACSYNMDEIDAAFFIQVVAQYPKNKQDGIMVHIERARVQFIDSLHPDTFNIEIKNGSAYRIAKD